MASKTSNRNLLPLLAVTAFFLSVSLVNYNDTFVMGDKSTKSVLSKSDERELDSEDGEDEKKESREKTEAKDREEIKSKNQINERKEVSKKEKVELKDERSMKYENLNEVKFEIVEEDKKNETDDDSDSDKNESETETEREYESVSENGEVSRFKLKIKTRTQDGKTIVETAAGEVEVSNSPDDTINDLVNDGLMDTPLSMEVKTNNDKVEFEIKGVEEKKLFGLFNLELPKAVTVDSETGEVLSTDQSIWNRFLNLLSV